MLMYNMNHSIILWIILSQTADTLSRIVQKFTNGEENLGYRQDLPKHIKLVDKIEGGGNSMFKALFTMLDETRDNLTVELQELRWV